MTRERDIENRLCRGVKKKGGLCLKFTSSEAGVPDRIVVCHGRVAFVEVKRPGGEVSAIQEYQHKQLLDAGGEVWILWNDDDVDNFVRGL